ncbi:unnamed protein product [Paramecium octaurelia]|uniref:Uncharacterized protein n=1 Tax=Paramecium octaurelia TaxID=43137 RepID=A0A8S1YPH7_PAROT|nr:unnamed protein product [Paramecium octaurelia]
MYFSQCILQKNSQIYQSQRHKEARKIYTIFQLPQKNRDQNIQINNRIAQDGRDFRLSQLFITRGKPKLLGKDIPAANLLQQKQFEKLNDARKDIYLITRLMKQILCHDFNNINYFTEINIYVKQALINKIGKNENIVEFLKYLVHLTSIDNNFIQTGSNSLHLLVEMNADLKMQSFTNIQIKNTSLLGSNFTKSDLSGSKFDNVVSNLRINELKQLKGHIASLNQVCFSSNGNSLASCSDDNSIRLWNIKTGKIKLMLVNGSKVEQICFSPNGIFKQERNHNCMAILEQRIHFVFLLIVIYQYLAVEIIQSTFGMFKQDYKNIKLKVILMQSYQCAFLLMIKHQPQGVRIILSVYGIFKQVNKNLNQMGINKKSMNFAFLQMVQHWHQGVKINLYVYGMFHQDNKYLYQLVIVKVSHQFVFFLMVQYQHLVAKIGLSGYGMSKPDNKKCNQMDIKMMQIPYAVLLMLQHQHLVVEICIYFMGCQIRITKILIKWSFWQGIMFMFFLIVLYQHLVMMIMLSVYGILKQDRKNSNQMAILGVSLLYVFLLMAQLQHLVEITPFGYGILIREGQILNQMAIKNMQCQYNFLLKVLNQYLEEMTRFVYGIHSN